MRKNTRKQAILSKCHDCMSQYADGRQDCGKPNCPLYAYMPYRQQEPDETWLYWNPKRVGLVKYVPSGPAPKEHHFRKRTERKMEV